MDNNQIETQPVNNEPVKKNSNKIIAVICIIACIIIVLGVVAFLNKDSLFGKNEPKEEIKTEEKQPEEKEPDPEPEQTEEDSTLKKGDLSVDEEKSSVSLELNDKKVELTSEITGTEKHQEINITLGKQKIHSQDISEYGINYVGYEIFNAKDGKEYLLLTIAESGEYYYIVDANGKTVSKIISFDKDKDCPIAPLDLEVEMMRIQDNEVYYFRRKANSKEKNGVFTMEEVKISINNSKATETLTGVLEDGILANCE